MAVFYPAKCSASNYNLLRPPDGLNLHDSLFYQIIQIQMRIRGVAEAEGDRVNTFLGEILDFFGRKPNPTDMIMVLVDYTRSVEDLAREARILLNTGTEGVVDSRLFPPNASRGKVSVEIRLVKFDRPMKSEEALQELDSLGYMPGNIFEFLAFAIQYSRISMQFVVAILGSLVRIDNRVLFASGDYHHMNGQIAAYFGMKDDCRGSIVLENFHDHRNNPASCVYIAVKK